jgi:hypothetical protein
MTNISINVAESPSFFRANGDLALSALVSMAGLVMNQAIVAMGILIV